MTNKIHRSLKQTDKAKILSRFYAGEALSFLSIIECCVTIRSFLLLNWSRGFGLAHCSFILISFWSFPPSSSAPEICLLSCERLFSIPIIRWLRSPYSKTMSFFVGQSFDIIPPVTSSSISIRDIHAHHHLLTLICHALTALLVSQAA